MEFNQSSMQSRETQFNSFKPTILVFNSTQFESIVHFQPGVLTKHLWEKTLLMVDESHQGGGGQLSSFTRLWVRMHQFISEKCHGICIVSEPTAGKNATEDPFIKHKNIQFDFSS